MQKENAVPRACPTPRCLGVRVGPEAFDDIALQEDGLLHPGTGGMTVVPDDPMFIPEWRRPKALPGGKSKDPLWVMSHLDVPDQLVYVPDDPNENGIVIHGLLEPAAIVTEAQFQADLASTKDDWREVPLTNDAPGQTPSADAG